MRINPLPVLLSAAGLFVLILSGERADAYSTIGPKWINPIVTYYVNPVTPDLPQGTTEAAVRAGADVWAMQSNANFRFVFGGRSTQSTTTNDGINLVVFRNQFNEINESAIATTTYTWSYDFDLIDTDIVFWDAPFQFYAGASGCSGGFYIEDVAAHEFGHALGLGHTTVTGATMYPSISTCSTGARSLEADDIAGVISLYPPVLPPAPTGFRIIRP